MEADEGIEGAVCPDALLAVFEEIGIGSLDTDDASDKLAGNNAAVFKAPLPGEIRRVGNEVLCGDAKCGTLAYLVHWNPAAIAANCVVHSNCYLTAPLIDSDEDSLIRWLGEGFCFRSAEDHRSCAPKGCYSSRKPSFRAAK